MAASVNLGRMKGRQESLKSRWSKKDQAPTRIVPVESGRLVSGECGPPSKGPSEKTADGGRAVTKC